MDLLTPRQKEILFRTIESYIETSQPVGSGTLTRRYHLGLSPASVRHELGSLEEMGFLGHPHTSAGRVPTDKGYQFYAQSVQQEPVSADLLKWIAREMEQRIEGLESLMGRVSSILSVMTNEAVLVLSPTLKQLYLKQLGLVLIDSRRLLAVWCSTSGLTQNALVELDASVSTEELDKVRRFINEEFAGVALSDLEARVAERLEFCRDSLLEIHERTLEIIRESRPHWESPRLCVEGSRYILNQPEFQDLKKFQKLIETLDNKTGLIQLLHRKTGGEGVQVAIGQRELPEGIWDCSLVSAPYRCTGEFTGVLGVLGPRRMPYGRIMGLVQQVAGEMETIFSRWGSGG